MQLFGKISGHQILEELELTNNQEFIKLLPVSVLPLSKVVSDYIESKDSITQRFQSFATDYKSLLYKRLSETQKHRNFINSLFTKHTEKNPFSDSQNESLKLFQSKNAAAVVTGQQAGLLGGPLYVWSKIAHTIARAKKATIELQHPVVPIFWLEDNDHDTEEAGTANFFDSHYDVDTLKYSKTRDQNAVLSSLYLDESVEVYLKKLFELKSNQFVKEQIERIIPFLRAGTSVSDSFHSLVHTSFKDYGLLILRSSDIRENKGYVEILQQEFENPIASFEAIKKGTYSVLEKGYKEQVQVQVGQAFYHDGIKRKKISINSEGKYTFHTRTVLKSEFIELFQNEPTNFSPSALLRLVSQDVLLPSIEVVVGPGELAYAAQTKELYSLYNITQPKFVFRNHSCALLESSIERTLQRESRPLEWCFLESSILEREINEELIKNYSVEENYKELNETIAQSFLKLKKPIVLLDKSMLGHFLSLEQKFLKLIKKSKKKTIASVKRQNNLRLDKIKLISKLFLPKGRQQERYICSSYFMIKYGIEELPRLLVKSFEGNEQKLVVLPSINPK